MNIEEALNLIPDYIVLRPGTPLQKGDETLETPEGFSGHGDWIADCYPEGHGVGGFTEARRPIPESVRKAIAQQMLRFSGSNGFLYPFEVWLLSTQERK